MDSVSGEPWHVSTSLHDVTSLKIGLNINRCKKLQIFGLSFLSGIFMEGHGKQRVKMNICFFEGIFNQF